jgi:hypothetical protein
MWAIYNSGLSTRKEYSVWKAIIKQTVKWCLYHLWDDVERKKKYPNIPLLFDNDLKAK